jgi:xanthine dehydrogenase accessory factor
MSDSEQILDTASEWHRGGHSVALATVVTTWGSSPRPVGSKLVVDEAGRMLGSVSGGCVEGAVVEAALESIRTGKPRLLDFGVTDEQAWEVGLACGGRVQIFVDRLEHNSLERLLALGRTATAVALVTHLATGEQASLTQAEAQGNLTLGADELAQARQALDDDQSRIFETAQGTLFVEVWNPSPRLLIVGAVHAAQALVPLARLAGYDVTVIDPREAFGSPARFADVTLRNDWPEEAFAALLPDRRTAILTLTHDPKIDDPALQAALRSQAFYVGALGSRRTHAQRVDRLRAAGFDDAAINRIRGPVGLAIGARTPAEIAISIMAEITAVLRRAPLANRT